MEAELIEVPGEVFDPDFYEFLLADEKLDSLSALQVQFETYFLRQYGLLSGQLLLITLVDNLKFEVEVQFGVVVVNVVEKSFLAECDVLVGHHDIYLLVFVPVDPEGALQTGGVVLDCGDDGFGDGLEDGWLTGARFAHI